MTRYITIAALLLMVAGLVWQQRVTKCNLQNVTQERDQLKDKYLRCITAATERDTIYLERVVEVPKIIYHTATDSVIDTVTVNEPLYTRYYQDSVVMDSLVTIHYKIQTAGKLKWAQYRYRARLPVVTQNNIIYQDKLIEKKFHLYTFLDVGINEHAFSAGVLGSLNNIGVGYRYDLTHGTHHASVAYKLR